MSLSRLHKFKLFPANRSLEASATSKPSNSMSPTKSPVFHLQRRKTLRMLFEKSSDRHRRNLRQILEESPESDENPGKKKRGNNRARRKLKELLVTSPSPPFKGREDINVSGEEEISEDSPVTVSSVTSSGDGRELTSRRFVSSGSVQSFRLRILRKPWRPVLVSIPEQ